MSKARVLVIALAALALAVPATGVAGSSGGDEAASAAKKGKCKGKRGKGKSFAAQSAKKRRGCNGKGKGKGKGKPPAPAATTLTLTDYSDTVSTTDVIDGTVSSPNAACKSSRQIKLYRKVGAGSEYTGVTRNIFQGFIHIVFENEGYSSGDQFFVTIPAGNVDGVPCAADTSNTITRP